MTSERLEPRRLLATLELDLSFSDGGLAKLEEELSVTALHVVRQLPDGRIVAAGTAASDQGTPLVVRLNSNGTFDKTFDGDGRLEISAAAPVGAAQAAVAPDGKIVLVHSQAGAIRVDRFNADGTVDAGFGTGGAVTVATGATGVKAVGVQPDGKILVLHGPGNPGQFILRLNANGSVDNGFRGGTSSSIPIPRLLVRADMAVDSGGKIYVVGDDNESPGVGRSYVGRLRADGSIDTSFGDGGDGFVRVGAPGIATVVDYSAIAVDPQDRPVVTSWNRTTPGQMPTVLTRLTTAGGHDTSFGGGDGWVQLETDDATAVPALFDAAGNITLALEADIGVPGIFRFSPDGVPDASFGDNGKAVTGQRFFRPRASALGAGGSLFSAGQLYPGSDVALARFVPDSPDVVVDPQGIIRVSMTDGDDTVTLRAVGNQVVVVRNGASTSLAASVVKGLDIIASPGDDTIDVQLALTCTIAGGAGNDTITVGDGQMFIDGGDGDDVIGTGRGAHTIDLGDGNDRASTGAGNDRIGGDDGNDTITTGPGGDFVSGDRGDDSITTSVGYDTIYTSDGNDTVRAGAGHDLVIGSPAPNGSHDQNDGSKLIVGGDGDDSLMGGRGASTVLGEGGNDTITGGPQSDSLDGGEGDDEIGSLPSSAGPDTIVSAGPEDDPPPVPPQPVDGEHEAVVITENTAGGFDLALADDGSYLVAANIVRGDLHRVTVFRYSAADELLGDPIPLYTYVPQTVPFLRTASISASIDADGDAVVAYRVIDGDDSGTYFTLISRTGTVGRTVRVGDADPDFGGSVSVSMDSGGGFFLAWHVPDGRDGFSHARAYDASGEARAEPFVIAPPPGLHSNGPTQIVSLPDGSGAVFARDFDVTVGLSMIGTVVFGRTSTSAIVDSGSISEPYDVSSPSIAVQPDGSFALTYRYFDGPAVYGAHLRRYTAAADQIGELFALGSSLPDGGNGIRSASVDAAPDGGYVVSFVDPADDAETLYAARFDAGGTLDAIRGYVPVANQVVGARVAADARGEVVAAYTSRSSDELRSRRLTVNMAVLRGTELFVDGSDDADHIIVEAVRENLFVNVNGRVQRFRAADVQFLSISGLGGDDDIVNATALPATIHGGDGADTIWGGIGPDRIRGFGGDDRLFGGDGDDQVLGDAGSDHVSGGDDNDNLQGDVGEDTLLGGSGNDVLLGHRGSDRLFGEAGNDVLLGGDADDYLEAGAGHDELYGQNGRDALFGLSGNDRLFADDGAGDTVRGGLGDDSADVDLEDDVLAVEHVGEGVRLAVTQVR